MTKVFFSIPPSSSFSQPEILKPLTPISSGRLSSIKEDGCEKDTFPQVFSRLCNIGATSFTKRQNLSLSAINSIANKIVDKPRTPSLPSANLLVSAGFNKQNALSLAFAQRCLELDKFLTWHSKDSGIYYQCLDRWVEGSVGKEEKQNAIRARELIKEVCEFGASDAWLSLSGLNLKSLPPFPSWIKKLDVSVNLLTSLSIERLPPGLTHLTANGNDIENIAGELPDSLVYIDISSCRLNEMPKLPVKLEECNLSANNIRFLPEKWPNTLKLLDVTINPIVRPLPPIEVPLGLQLYI